MIGFLRIVGLMIEQTAAQFTPFIGEGRFDSLAPAALGYQGNRPPVPILPGAPRDFTGLVFRRQPELEYRWLDAPVDVDLVERKHRHRQLLLLQQRLDLLLAQGSDDEARTVRDRLLVARHGVGGIRPDVIEAQHGPQAAVGGVVIGGQYAVAYGGGGFRQSAAERQQDGDLLR